MFQQRFFLNKFPAIVLRNSMPFGLFQLSGLLFGYFRSLRPRPMTSHTYWTLTGPRQIQSLSYLSHKE